MEGPIWREILSLLPEASKTLGRFRHDTRTILMVILWAILRDRPMNWACREENWPAGQRPAKLPSPSTISRRWRQSRLHDWAKQIHEQAVARVGFRSAYAVVDAKPLPVGGGSKDPDARPGRAVGHLSKGHKLFAVVAAGGAIAQYEIGAMGDHELTKARQLLAAAPQALSRIIGDGLYDSTPLHRIAAAHGRRLYTPLRQQRVGRRQQPERLRLLKLAGRKVGQKLLHSRDQVERTFGLMTNFACGFKGLPNWARRTHRVFRWMWGKIIIYHTYLLLRNQSQTTH